MKMPYRVPESREIDPTVARIDKNITQYEPLSDMRWYRSSKKANEQVDPSLLGSKVEARRQKHVKHILLPDTDGLVPVKRVKADLNTSSDRYRTLETILGDSDTKAIKDAKIDPHQTYITYYRPELDDELVLKPCDEYMNEVRAKEILHDEDVEREELRRKKFKSRSQVRKELYGEDDEDFELKTVKVPKKQMNMGTPLADLEARRKVLIPDRAERKKIQIGSDSEDEALANIKSGSWKYAGMREQMEFDAKKNRSRAQPAEEPARQRYVPTADADEAYLETLRPPARKTRAAEYLINKKPLGQADFETHELLQPQRRLYQDYEDSDEEEARPVRRRRRRDSGSSIFTAPGRHGHFEEDFGEETLEFTSSKYKKQTKSSASSFDVPTIETSPTFQIRLKSHVVPAGSKTKFMCSVVGKPRPQITWSHNGTTLTNGGKYQIEDLAGVLTLTIHNCNADDAGTYQARAFNTAGESSDYATLEIGEYGSTKSQRGISEGTKMSSMKMDEWSMREPYRKSTQAVAGGRKLPGEPYFLSAPRDQTVADGETARFTANVDGSPMPRTMWQRMGANLRDSDKFYIRSIRNQQVLEIRNASVIDAGEYAVTIQSLKGEETAYFQLNVQGRARSRAAAASPTPSTGSRTSRSSRKGKPMVISELHGQIQLNGSVKLDCSVMDEHAVKSVVWYKNDRQLPSSNATSSAGQYTYTIDGVTAADAGHYACHLVGLSGSITTSYELIEDRIADYAANAAKVQRVTSPVKIADEVTLESLPAQLEVAADTVLSLSTTFTGSPGKIEWKRNGEVLADGDEGGRVTVETTLSSTTLTVLAVSADDAGRYRLTVGDEASTAVVSIV